MKNFIKKYYYFGFLFFFLLMVILIKLGFTTKIDLAIYNFSQRFLSNFTTSLMKVITFFASPICIVGFLLLSLLFIGKKSLFLIFAVGLNQIINQVLKMIIARPRPDFPHLVVEGGYSCPSGHAMGSVMFYGVLCYFIWQSNLNDVIKKGMIITLMLMILGIGFSRIYLGVHFFSDIIAGMSLSLFLLILCCKYHLKTN